jgi:hypothetical protein
MQRGELCAVSVLRVVRSECSDDLLHDKEMTTVRANAAMLDAVFRGAVDHHDSLRLV